MVQLGADICLAFIQSKSSGATETARYAHHVVAMKSGRVVAEGPPAAVVTEELVAEVFGLDCAVVPCPVSARPLVIPRGRHGTASGTGPR